MTHCRERTEESLALENNWKLVESQSFHDAVSWLLNGVLFPVCAMEKTSCNLSCTPQLPREIWYTLLHVRSVEETMKVTNDAINRKYLEVLRHKSGVMSCIALDADFMRAHFGREAGVKDYIDVSHETLNPIVHGFSMRDFVPALKFETEIVGRDGDTVTERMTLDTAIGEKYFEVSHSANTHIRLGEAHVAPVETKDDFAIFDWYCDVVRQNNWSAFKRAAEDTRALYGNAVILSMFLTPPFELLYFTRRENIIYLYHDHPEEYRKAMEAVNKAYEVLVGIGAENGVQMIGYGAPGGTEFTSPSMWKDAIVPSSRALEAAAKKAGLYTQFHCCGKITKIIEDGYLNEIKPSLYETFSPPPAGDVIEPARLRHILDRDIVIRGNIDLGLLRDGSVGDVLAAAERLLSEVRGYPHILGASDSCLWPGTSLDNIVALGRRYNSP